MSELTADRLYREGLAALDQGNALAALAFFEKALLVREHPVYRSYFAYCIARERGQAVRAEEICREAVQREPQSPELFLNLGRVLFLAGRKSEAIEAYRQGMRCGEHPEIMRELNRLGIRRKPVIPFLRRNHPLNKYLGIILRRLRIR